MIEIIDDSNNMNDACFERHSEIASDHNSDACIICLDSEDLQVEIGSFSKPIKFCLELITDFCISEVILL